MLVQSVNYIYTKNRKDKFQNKKFQSQECLRKVVGKQKIILVGEMTEKAGA